MKKEYFERLFPSVIEQKPGKDLYPEDLRPADGDSDIHTTLLGIDECQ